jgi:hypothetical protein
MAESGTGTYLALMVENRLNTTADDREMACCCGFLTRCSRDSARQEHLDSRFSRLPGKGMLPITLYYEHDSIGWRKGDFSSIINPVCLL